MTTATAILLLIVSAFLASFIQRVTGFGFGIVFMTMAPYYMPSYAEATALSGLLALLTAIGIGIKVLRHIPLKKLAVITVTFLIVSFFAVRLVAGVDNRTLKHILGIFLILISLYFHFINGKIRMKPNIGTQIGMGTLSGMTGGLFGMQGPPAVIYFISCTESKEEYMAMTQFYFIAGNVAMTFYRAGNGFVTGDVWKMFLIGVLAVVAGLGTGSLLYRRLKIETIRKIVYVFIGVAGVLALFL